ncbi:MAG TPA: chemotaxis protein CheB, partial [Deferrisomatales bacterium]|nr:chemotaxis protein CheB [Deferrisomatales bacterium]
MRRSGRRVLVVDDSPYTRQVLREMLEAEPLVGEVEVAGNGQIALDKALRKPPDLVLLDLQMPVMDGFTFLRLFRRHSAAPVLVVSALRDLAQAEKSLELGASGFIAKPADAYRELKLISRELSAKLREHLAGARPAAPASAPSGAGGAAFPVVVIGSSSGGPPTLQYLLTGLPASLAAAVLIAQHLPPGFTESFAQRLDGLIPHPVREAQDGQSLTPGEVVICPGGRNLAVRPGSGRERLTLENPRSTLQVPSVDRLFTSAAEVLGPRVTAFVLTGMGRDGSEGVRAVKAAGGIVYAESEETAAIYGMPREAAATGCVEEVLPLPEIAVRLI